MSNSSKQGFTFLRYRREKVVKVASLSTHLVWSDEWRTDRRVFTSVGGSWSARQGLPRPGVIITTCTSNLGTVERVTRLLSKSTTEFPGRKGKGKQGKGQPTHTDSQRGGWHYWQRPSGENAAGAKRGRPAPGEQGREEREPGGRWKSQGRPGHLTEIPAFILCFGSAKSFWNESTGEESVWTPSFLYRANFPPPSSSMENAGLDHLEWREPHAGRPARTVFRGIRPDPTRLEGLRN